MRKIWYLAIFLAILTPTIIALGLAFPEPVGNGLHLIFVKTLGEGTANLIVGAVTGLFLWGAVNGLQAAAVLFGIWIVGGLMWLGLQRFVRPHTPFAKKTTSIPSTSKTSVREEPSDIVIAESATPTKTKPEEPKKEEVAIAE